MAIILRKAVLMEDEGRESFVSHLPITQARQRVQEQEGKYFRPSDYRIIPEEGEE